LKGQYKGAREMAHDIEMLNSQLATLESDHNKMELENRSLMEQLARNEVQIQDLESERLELFAAKEMLKKLENVNKEKQTLAQDLRHTQDLADESERQKKTLEEILKERERYLGQKEKELDKKNTELANAQLSKESLTRDLQQKQMDLSIQNKDLEARLREAERGRTEDFRALQAEKESAQREAKAAIKAASGEVQQIKQRLLIMQKERSGLEMQVKALQEAASFLGGTGDFAVKPSAADFTSTPLKPLGTMGTDEDFDLDITPARSRGALPPVQKAQKGHMPRPPPQAAKKDFFAATGGSSGSGSGRMMDDYSGIMEDY
jgi:chromosome segregation ATPase